MESSPVHSCGRLAFCSIATARYRTQALTALLSLKEQHPEARCTLLCIDDIDRPMPDGIGRLRLEDCIPERMLDAMRRRYTVQELCFASKPYLLSRVLETGVDQAHYLDGDCLAFGRLDPLIAQLAGADLLLTPHSLSPILNDGLTPRPLTLLRAGVFNGGYLSVRNTDAGREFLAWLSSMTRQYARNAPREGMCGDQRWLDLAPVLFAGTAICRYAGANVAYWNLHERRLSRDGQNRPLVNGEPLMFFHFSGYDRFRPAQLSRHQNRHSVVAGSVLEELVTEYRQRWLDNLRFEPQLSLLGRWRRRFAMD